jgi:hypothetical protein
MLKVKGLSLFGASAVNRNKRFSFGLLLLLVLLVHGLILGWLSDRMQGLQPLIPMAAPMLTRIVEQVRAALPVRPASRGTRSKLASAVPAVSGMEENQIKPDLTDEQASAVVEPPESAPPVVEPRPAPLAEEEPADGDSWPVDTRVSYDLSGNYRGELFGSARVQWQRERSRYQVRLDLSLALLRISMISQGEVGSAGLLPGIYEERFPWGSRSMVFEGGWVKFDNGVQLPQPPNLQDTVSQFVELSHRFSSGSEVLKVGGKVQLWLVRPQGIALWTYDVVEEEILQTPELGAVSAFHLRPRQIANPSGVITAEMWFAPSLQYLPVRVRIALGADNFVDLLVERIEQGVVRTTPQSSWRDGP